MSAPSIFPKLMIDTSIKEENMEIEMSPQEAEIAKNGDAGQAEALLAKKKGFIEMEAK